jgi:hypothetical protein
LKPLGLRQRFSLGDTVRPIHPFHKKKLNLKSMHILQLVYFCLAGLSFAQAFSVDSDSLHAIKTAFSAIMNNIDRKIDEAVDQSLPQLNDILMLNSSSYYKDLTAQGDWLKKDLKHELRYDFFTVVKDAALSRFKLGPKATEQDEKLFIAEQIQNKWQATVQARLQTWSEGRVTPWVHQSRPIWSGLENFLKDRIVKFKDFIEHQWLWGNKTKSLEKRGLGDYIPFALVNHQESENGTVAGNATMPDSQNETAPETMPSPPVTPVPSPEKNPVPVVPAPGKNPTDVIPSPSQEPSKAIDFARFLPPGSVVVTVFSIIVVAIIALLVSNPITLAVACKSLLIRLESEMI